MATKIDITIGKRLKEAREKLGISQTDLGEAVGVSFQQIQKYEKGANRLSVSRLIYICNYLGANIGYFIGDMLFAPIKKTKPVFYLDKTAGRSGDHQG